MKKVKLLICITMLFILVGITGSVSAADTIQSLTFTPEASTKTLKEGDTVTITLKLSNINMGEDGINTFGGKLVYDENVFEKVKADDCVAQNNWSMTYNDEETAKKGTFLVNRGTGTKDNQTIGTIKLKVKTKLKSTTTKIQFTELSSVGTDTVAIGNKTITLNVTGTVKEETNTGTKKPTTSDKKDNTTSKKKIPQTGVQDVLLITTTIAFVAIAVFAYIKLNKEKDIK